MKKTANKTIVMEKGKGRKLVDRFESQIDRITKELQKSGYRPPFIGNIFEYPEEVFTYQVFCYVGYGQGKKFEYSLLPDGKIRPVLNSKN